MTKVRVSTEIEGVLSTQEACAILGIHYATLFRWIRAGKVMVVKIGRRTLIPKTEIDRLANVSAIESREL